MDKADQVAPLVPMLNRRERPLTIETPDFVQDRLQPDAVLIDRPEFDLRLGEGGRGCPEEWAELFF